MSIRPIPGGTRRQPNTRSPTATPGAASGSTSHPTPQPAPPLTPGQTAATGSAAQQTAARLATVRQPGTALATPLPNAQAVSPATRPSEHPAIQDAQRFPRWAVQAEQALRSLPRLRIHGSGDSHLLSGLAQHLVDIPSGDPLRIDIVRIATHFLRHNDEGEVNPASLDQLGRLAFGAIDHPATPEQIQQALGTERERNAALIDNMPRWAGRLSVRDGHQITQLLPPSIVGAPNYLGSDLQSFFRTMSEPRHEHHFRLPDHIYWLKATEWHDKIIDRYETFSNARGSDRTLPADLLRVASDLSALPSTKHKLAAFLERAFARDDVRREVTQHLDYAVPQLFTSGERRLILEALVRQLPHPGFGNPATQQDILRLVKLQFQSQGMDKFDKYRLASCLQGVTAALPTSRVHGPADVQGSALKALGQAMPNLLDSHSSQIMQAMLNGHDALSTQRRPSAMAPRHRSEMRQVMKAQGSTLFLPISVGTLMGRPSPADKSCKYVLRALQAKLRSGASVYTANSLLPICRRLLCEPPRIDQKQAKQLTPKVVAILAAGGLPFGLGPEARDKTISKALGDEVKLRSEAARLLVGMAKAGDGSTEGAALNEQRIGAARYLHNLLAAGSHDLDLLEIARAREVIRQTCLDVSPDARSLPIIGALLADAAGQVDGTTALPTLVGKLSDGFRHLDNEDAQHVIGELTTVYASLPASDQHGLAQAMVDRLPLPPAEPDPRPTEHWPAALRRAVGAQRIGVALVENLVRNDNSETGPLIHWAGEAFKRLNPTNRSAALNMAFDGFAQASTAGRDTAIRFVDTLDDSSEFTTGAIKLVQNGFADDVADQLEPSVKAALVNSINRRLPTLSPDDTSTLVANCATHGVDLPPELMSSFIREAPKLDTASLRQLLVTWESSLRQQTPELNQQQHQQWMDAARYSKSETADIVHAFMRVAAQAHPSQQLPPSKHPVTPEAAHHLASALPHMDASTMQAAFTHIGQVSLPDEARAEVVSAVFNQLRRFDLPEREKAIGLCLRLDRGRTLSTLAANFGMPMLGPRNRIDRLPVDQPIATLQGPPTTFAQQIAGMPGAQAGPILEVLAEHIFNAPAQQQQPMQQLIGQELPRLPQRHQDRLRQTYLYSNRDWVDQLRDPDRRQDMTEVNRMRRHMHTAAVDSIRRLGEDPGSSTWQELLHTDRQRVPELLHALQETRGQTHGAPTSREEVSVDEFFTPPGSPSQFGQAGPPGRQ